MASQRWISTAVVAAGIAALSHGAARGQAVPLADTPVNPQTLVTQDLESLKAALVRPTPPITDPNLAAIQQQRDEAAHRLLSRGSAAADAILLDVLKNSPSRDARLAVARAIADDPRPDPQFAPALLPLIGGERVLSDAAARAYARYGGDPAVRRQLIEFAQDANRPPNLRIGVVRALGQITERDVANTLVSLAGDAKQGQAIQNAAMDALAELTGLVGNNHSLAKWQQWQTANANKADAAWRDDVLIARGIRAAEADRAQNNMIAEMKQILDEEYERGNDKSFLLMRELNSYDPYVREMGAQKVTSEKANGHGLPAAAPKRLEEMVGDSAANVRLAVAQAIGAENDAGALDALVAQLPQETSPEAKKAEIETLAKMRRLRAVPALRQAVHDKSIDVAMQAVNALRGMADTILRQDPALAAAVAQELWQTGQQRASQPGGEAFQAATIEAVGALKSRELAGSLLGLLNLNNSPAIRSAALRGLANLGDRKTFFAISQWLGNEPNAAVRVDAIAALGSTGNFESAADTLYHYMSPNVEPDPAVRDQAWLQFQSLLDSANNVEVLNRWADEFKNDPARRLQVLLALNKKLQHDMNFEALAYSRQNTGEVYMDPKINDPARAAIQFDLALTYWQQKQTPSSVTPTLIRQLLAALLAAKDYDKVASFSAKQITRDPTTINQELREAVNRLHDEALRDNDQAKLRDGIKLSEAVLKMQPALSERNQNDVRQLMQEMQAHLKK